MYPGKRSAGFTLMELMIVVAIIGILASVGYPAYTSYITKAKRSDAKSALLKAQIAQEKYRANHTTYGTTLAAISVSSTSADGYYTIAISGTPDATNYTMTAAPGFTDSDCGTFAVNKDGKTTSSSVQTTTAKVNECW
jgi:type IV pilus assembly protein PilE